MRLLLAAGGTGGHVFPALAVARAVRERDATAEVLFVGTPQGFETQLVPPAGFRIETIDIRGLNRVGRLRQILHLLLLPAAFWKAKRLLGRFAPTVVFGIGGYASGPVLLLAALARTKTAILEPNAVAGFSNRLLGRWVDRIFLAFGEANSAFAPEKCVVSGNPIRAEIVAVAPPTFEGTMRTVLVFGGSQGARRLNEAMIGGLEEFKKRGENLFFLHQSGAPDEERVRQAYAKAGVRAEVRAFFDDMAEAFRRADLVVARSGSSVLEIAATGRPSVLVPFPAAADDHQRSNARILERVGAAIYLEDASCTPETLSEIVLDLAADTKRLRSMSQAALKLRCADAAQRIANDLFDLCGERMAA